MAEQNKTLRLDQILIYEGLITEEQVKQALSDQKEKGGKFGSHLLYNKFINETNLVRALAKQLNCRAVILTNLAIPEKILELIPAKFAVAKKVIPFDYDLNSNVIKFACDNPLDETLKKELIFVTGHGKIELFLAAELVLNTAIAKHYLDYDTENLDNYLLELPKIYDEYMVKQFTGEASGGTKVVNEPNNRKVLIVSDCKDIIPHLKKLFEDDSFEVDTIDSADDAITKLGDVTYHSVYIQDTVSGDYIDLIDRVRKLSPSTEIRYYESVPSLILDRRTHEVEASLMAQNLKLLTSLLTDKDKLAENHNEIVGKFVQKLCGRLELPFKERTSIINAAYIHDLAKFYYPEEYKENSDFRAIIAKTIKLLVSLNYSPVIIEILRSMYKDLKKKFTKRLPIEILGGNIITIADLVAHSMDVNEKLTFEKFETIKRKIKDLTGDLFLAEVAEAFVEMIEESIIHESEKLPFNQIMLYNRYSELTDSLETRLISDQFRTITVDNPNTFLELFKRSKPDFIIMLFNDSVDAVKNEIQKIAALGLNFNTLPTFVMTKSETVTALAPVIEMGVEDILSNEGNIELLIAKLRKLQNEITEHASQKIEIADASGTKGLLKDMDLIDLIQVMGSGKRTLKLTVTSETNSEFPLMLFMDKGNIVFAQYADNLGPEAVYKAISWKDGSWRVESCESDDIPEHNNDLSNESILMEGCRLLDETRNINQEV